MWVYFYGETTEMDFVRNVLLLDDNPSCNFIMSEFIKLADETINVVCRESAEDAIEYLRSPDIVFPDVIYVDINMPVMSGFEFIEHFEKEFYSTRPRTRLFMLSSSLRFDDKQRALAFDSVVDFVSKSDIDDFLQSTLTRAVA